MCVCCIKINSGLVDVQQELTGLRLVVVMLLKRRVCGTFIKHHDWLTASHMADTSVDDSVSESHGLVVNSSILTIHC